jgi:hypothetical protein
VLKDLYPEDFRGALKKGKSKGSRQLAVPISDGMSSDGSHYESANEDLTPTNRDSMRSLQLDASTNSQSDSAKQIEEPITNNPSIDAEAEMPLKYPPRLVTFFLPPGFHNWTNAFRFLGEFFFLSKFSRRVARARETMFGGGISPTMSKREEMRIHEELIVLTQQEGEDFY